MSKGKNKNQTRNNSRGERNHQSGTVRQPHTEYQEAFPSYERHNSSGKNNGSSHHQGDSQFSTSGGSRDHDDSRQGGRERGEYRPNDYQRQVDSLEEIRRGNEGKRDYSQQGSQQENRQQKNHGSIQHRDDGQHVKNNLGQQKSSWPEDSSQSEKNNKLNSLKCVTCHNFYDTSSRLPRCLKCGHTACTACLQNLIKKDFNCPTCKRPMKKLNNVEEAQVNFTVRELAQSRLTAVENNVKTESRGAESMSCRPKSESDKPIVNASPNKPSGGKSSYSKNEEMEWSPSPEKSPHNSRCLEGGISPTAHCATCLKWVCNKCGSIDHNQQKGCFLIPKKEALSQMTKAQLDGAKGSSETVENTLTELDDYNERLDALSLAMQAAFESIAAEKDRVKALVREGRREKKELAAAVASLPNSTTLPHALDALRQVEDHCGLTKVWTTTNASKTLDQKRVNYIIKEILLSTVQMKMMAGSNAKAAAPVLAQHCHKGVHLSSHMEVDGGRINVHALIKVDTVPKGSRALPLTNVMSCLDPGSALTFLDIGWGGSVKGRVFVRLLGDTLRGRLFVTLCTGKAGPSFRGTKFHRVWWKGLPGEHLWGGDHDQGNGSGGASVLEASDREKSSLVHGRCLTIRAGLVAGRYEKTGISSIFRIYTKDCMKGKDASSYLSKGSEEVKDEAAFGIVEYGLQVLESAVKLNNIQEVTILDCGIVIET